MFWQSGKKRYDKIDRYLPALQILLSAGMKINGHNPAVINRKVFQDISPIAWKNAPNRRMGEINRLKCQRCEKSGGRYIRCLAWRQYSASMVDAAKI